MWTDFTFAGVTLFSNRVGQNVEARGQDPRSDPPIEVSPEEGPPVNQQAAQLDPWSAFQTSLNRPPRTVKRGCVITEQSLLRFSIHKCKLSSTIDLHSNHHHHHQPLPPTPFHRPLERNPFSSLTLCSASLFSAAVSI